MAGMKAIRLVGGIKGEDKANRPRKPKERGSKPNEPTW